MNKLAMIVFFALLSGCISEAGNWRPPHEPVEPPHVPVCEQWGSKLYDRVTGKECPDLHRHKPRCHAPASTGECL